MPIDSSASESRLPSWNEPSGKVSTVEALQAPALEIVSIGRAPCVTDFAKRRRKKPKDTRGTRGRKPNTRLQQFILANQNLGPKALRAKFKKTYPNVKAPTDGAIRTQRSRLRVTRRQK